MVKTKCENAMLLENMNISRLITYAQQVMSDKLREHAKENNKGRTIMSILHKNWILEIARRLVEILSSCTFIS